MFDPLDGAPLGEVTFIVVACEFTQPPKHQPEPIELAAICLRAAEKGWSRSVAFDSLIRPPQHAPLTVLDISTTGINPLMMASKPSAGHVLAQLDSMFCTLPTCWSPTRPAHSPASSIATASIAPPWP